MTKCAFIPNFFRFYNTLWQAALPFLKRNVRLEKTIAQRTRADHLARADLWIQAASAGEAFLAVSLLGELAPGKPLTVLVTTTTDQGMEILETAGPLHPNLTVQLDWFIFDIPKVVETAVTRIRPHVMVLLETEIWPALFHTLKRHSIKTLIINARLSDKSARHYRLTRWLWKCLSPDQIAAISFDHARKYETLFPDARISVMNNIKFDIMDAGPEPTDRTDPLAGFFPAKVPVMILASFRRQEEPDLIRIIQALAQEKPDQVIAVFPRHMHRIRAVAGQLKRRGLAYCLRSGMSGAMQGPGIILWDRFGDLRAAYAHASSVFVGGSLRPLGGQNFLEPLVHGTPTVIGPHWADFSWLGPEIFDLDFLDQAGTWQAVARTMARQRDRGLPRQRCRDQARAYIRTRKGGTRLACTRILAALDLPAG